MYISSLVYRLVALASMLSRYKLDLRADLSLFALHLPFPCPSREAPSPNFQAPQHHADPSPEQIKKAHAEWDYT